MMTNKATITWLGHASLTVASQGKMIYLDPWIDDNPSCSLELKEIKSADVVCVTHGHRDHLGDALEIAKQTGAKLLCTPEIAYYADKQGVKYNQHSYPLNIGGCWANDTLRITMVNALHTSDICGEEFKSQGIVMPGSGSCGYVLEIFDGPRIYYSGDTGVFGDMGLIRELYRPDVAILSAGGKFNMGHREAAYAAGLLQPDLLLAVHHGTFPDQVLDVDRFRRELATRAPWVRFLDIGPGQSIEYPDA